MHQLDEAYSGQPLLRHRFSSVGIVETVGELSKYPIQGLSVFVADAEVILVQRMCETFQSIV